MAVICALSAATIYYSRPLLPQIAESFGITSAQASLVSTLAQLGYAVGLLLIVPLADRQQPRTLASIAIAANAVMLLACAWAPSFHLLCGASFAVGVTAVTAQIIMPALWGLATPASRGRTRGILLSGLSTGLLLACTCSCFIGARAGWRAVFVRASVVDMMLLAIVLRNSPASPSLAAISYRRPSCCQLVAWCVRNAYCDYRRRRAS